MKKSISLIISLLILPCMAYNIILPESPTPAEKTAAKELEHYLKLVAPEVLTVDGADPEIHIGPTAAAKANGLDQLADEEWCVKSLDGKLFLIGGGTRGTLYATYHFLEDSLGIHWFNPYEDYVPAASEVQLPALDMRGKPLFTHRSIARQSRGELPLDNGRFVTRNRMNYDANSSIGPEYGGDDCFGLPYFVHTFGLYFPGKDYPQYGTLVNGKRGASNHVCMSLPELPDLFYAKLLEFIKKSEDNARKKGVPSPRYYDISLDDGAYVCECDKCQAALKKRGGGVKLLLDFLNPIAAKLAESHPDLVLTTIIYANIITPPEKLKVEPNLMIRLCDIVANQAAPLTDKSNRYWAGMVDKWSKLAPLMGIWDYAITYVVTGAPYPFEQVIGEDLRFYADHGIRFMFWELELPHQADMYDLKIWLTMKLMENPYQDEKELYRTFMEKNYGAAAPALMEFRDLVAKYRTETNAYIDWYAKSTTLKHLNWKSIPEMQKCFDEAEAAVAEDPVLLKRVQRARVGLDRVSYILFPVLLTEFERAGHDRKEYPLNRDEILSRAEKYQLAAIEKLTPRAKKTKQDLHNDIIAEIKRYAKAPLMLRPPAEFAGVDYFDYPASDAYIWNEVATLVDDPTSETGQVLQITRDKPEFRVPFKYGAYVANTTKDLAGEYIRKVKGKGYHWYKVATIKLYPSTYIYFTGKWEVQFHTGDPAPGLDETYEIWVRLKFTGPAYFPGDKTPNTTYIERLLLVPVSNGNAAKIKVK